MKTRSTFSFLNWIIVLTLLLAAWPAQSAMTLGARPSPAFSYPTDPTADIPWSPANFNGVADIQAAFNNARTAENTMWAFNIPMLTMPDQATWDGMTDGRKALWLINEERTARGVAPLQDVEANVTSVAQTFAQYLLDHDAFDHNADGRTPWQRLAANPVIGPCQDSLGVSENLFVSVTSGSSIPLPIEQAVYNWNYVDAGSNWGHRHAMLWYPYNDNSGASGSEGFLGIGRAHGGPYQGPFPQSWNFAEIIVMNVFDPCATWIDVAPVVTSITRADPSPTGAAAVNFTVTFSEEVTGVNAADFHFNLSGVSGAVVANISGIGAVRTVTVNTGTGNGTLQLTVVDNDSIVDLVGNPLGGEGANNGDFNTGETYTISRPSDPSPVVTSVVLADANPTGAAAVNFTVTFSEEVTGVDTADFNLNVSGVSGASISGVGGSGAARTVTVNTGTGNGTIQLLVVDNDTIQDLTGNPLGGPGGGNGNFNTGGTYNVVRVTVTFVDVPSTHPFWSFIEIFSHAGITSGCSISPMMYCPDDAVTRGQMAVFLERAMGDFSPNPSPTDMFGDVLPGNPFKAYIEEFYNDRITAGCSTSPLMYCPEHPVTRAQMAVFLLRAKHGASYLPPDVGTSTGFGDVPTDYWAAAFIKQFVTEGITVGCGSGNYCPESPVTRGQMAVFIVRAFNLGTP